MTQTNWQVLKTGEAAHAPLPVSVPELLVPAGDLERLRLAVLYGADAVYLAGTTFGMRAFAGNFTETEMKEAVRFAHAHGVRVHVTVNTMPRNDEVARLPDYLATLEAYGVDALIVADVVCASCTEAHQHAGQCCQLPGGACLARSGGRSRNPGAGTDAGRNCRNPG